MNRVVIHVGLHKTATTFLQEVVFPDVKGFTYLTRPYTQLNHAFNTLQYADDSLYNPGYLEKELLQFRDSNLLLSDESFSGKPTYFSYINRSQIAKRLNEHFPNAEIILFLRDQVDIMVSHYNSYVKMPYGVKKITNLFYKPGANFQFSDQPEGLSTWDSSGIYYDTNDFYIHLDCFKYHCLVNLYKSLFDKVHIFTFEDLVHRPQLVQDKLKNIFEQDLAYEKSDAKNASFTPNQLKLLRLTNNITYPLKSRIINAASRKVISGLPIKGKSNFNQLMDKFVGDYYQADNALLKSQNPQLSWDQFPTKFSSN